MAKRRTGPRRNPAERERDLILVSELYLRGETQEAMAAAVSKAAGYEPALTRQQIGYDIKKLHARWLETQILNLEEAVARELARIDRLEREAWDAWERSQRDAETLTVKARQGVGGGAGGESIRKTEGQTGDASFLRVVQWCIEQRCRLLGLGSDRVDLTSAGQPLICEFIEVILDADEDDDMGENQAG